VLNHDLLIIIDKQGIISKWFYLHTVCLCYNNDIPTGTQHVFYSINYVHIQWNDREDILRIADKKNM